nr:MAG TPA: hypothetical protein [Caudoviricetes sp.]
MEELETVSVDLTGEDIIEIDEVIDLEIESVEEISIKEFQNNATEMLLYWSSASW